MLLDVGCGVGGVGDVNVDVFREGFNRQIGDQVCGELVNPHNIRNFVVADACHLPFRDGVFDVVVSSHVIEHVYFPVLMFSELCRVASLEVVIRCPHRRGSGAKRPFHVNYFDESWFSETAKLFGYSSVERVTVFDWCISDRLPFPRYLRGSLVWRVLKHVERLVLDPKRGFPSELESRIDVVRNRF